MHNQNIYAFTEPTPPVGYPAFVSLNKIAQQLPDVFRLTVRSGNGGFNTIAEIDLSADQICQLNEALNAMLAARKEQS